MGVIYIILGIICLGLSIYFIDKREKMKLNIRRIKDSKQQIVDLNNQLDDVIQQLDELEEPLSKVSQI